ADAPGSATPPSETAPAGAPQTTPTPLPATAPIATGAEPAVPPLASAAPSATLTPASPFRFAAHIAPGTLYVCAAASDGPQTPIEYEPKVRDLCAKHPEMGVC